ncbi:MAG: DUF4126 domain-containing protein [Pseudomonadota bacterium]
MDLVYALLIGIGLAAACGFRVFLPLLGLALAARFGNVTPGEDFGWLLTDAALVALATATLLEIAAYYLPLLDHILDAFTTPMAIIAGTLATAAMLSGIDDPLLKWGLALIAGGGAAGAVQAGSVVARAASTALTGGLGNPVVATLEWVGALIATILAFLVPALVVIGLLLVLAGLARRSRQKAATERGN